MKMNSNSIDRFAVSAAKNDITRRDFMTRLGGGIFVLFTIGIPAIEAQRRGGEYPDDFNAYLRIAEDGRVSCFTGKIEMGQGIITSFAQILAEDLGVELSRVDMVMGDTAVCPYDRGTTGSRSTKNFGPPLRQAAAKARYVLLQLASDELGIPMDRLVVENGIISDRQKPDRKISYGELARGKVIKRQVDKEVMPKPFSHHSICGKPTRRMDAMLKVTGEAKYAADIRMEGMLYASVLRPSSHKAILKSVDTSAAKEVPGAIVIEDGDLIAVLHEKPDVAQTALAKIKATFDAVEPPVDNNTIFSHLERSGSSQRVVTERGDIGAGKKVCEKSFEATFYNHYVAHAPIENHAVLVDIRDGNVTVWASSQTPFRVRSLVAETLAVSEDSVRVISPFLGGGFGGKKSGLDIVQAARLAKIAGRPVQISLTRKEEFFYDHFRPASIIKAKSGIDVNGRICLWDFNHFFSGTRSSEPIYEIPHYRVLGTGAGRGEGSAHPFETGAWRGPGSNSNVHAMESQTDMMAQAAGIDPLSFRLQNLSDARMQRVLKAAAGKFGKTFEKGPSGKGYGIACTNYLNTYIATMAEVQVDEQTGRVHVKRVVSAQDMGEVINPEGARLQIEGGVTMALGYCLGEEVKFEGGKVLTSNFDTYDITRFSWTPEIEAVLIDNPNMPPLGCGEPATTTMGGVIANAVYDAIGVRLYTLPMTPERVKAAIEESS